MLSTLIALSSLTMFNATGGQGGSVFPKPLVRTPEVLKDRAIFQYLKGSETWVTGVSQELDWSDLKLVNPKPTATKFEK
jgi:hypothetical protein